MRSGIASGLFVVALSASLASCGLFDGGEEREPWRVQAEARCVAQGAVKASAFTSALPRIDTPQTCGMDSPFRVNAILDGSVAIKPAARINCPQTAAIDHWTHTVVQPAAHAHFGMPVVALNNAASYGCRTRNHKRGAKLSEHSFGNALDISGFVLADGRTVTLLKGWRGATDERAFLREVSSGSCGIFRTVLGPGSDGKHEDHFHLDLALHDARGERTYCRPRPEPKPAPTFGIDSMPMAQAPAPMPRYEPDPASVPMSYAPLRRSIGGKPQIGPSASQQRLSIEDLLDE